MTNGRVTLYFFPISKLFQFWDLNLEEIQTLNQYMPLDLNQYAFGLGIFSHSVFFVTKFQLICLCYIKVDGWFSSGVWKVEWRSAWFQELWWKLCCHGAFYWWVSWNMIHLHWHTCKWLIKQNIKVTIFKISVLVALRLNYSI